MAGGAQTLDATALARKYRGKGQSDEQVYNTLRSLGLNAKDARAAVGPTSSPQGKAPAAAPAGPAAPTSPPATGGSGSSQPGLPGLPSMPSFSAPTNITLTPPRKLSSGDLGGFLAGLLLYALALNYLTHGTEGVKGWFSAKFLNEPAELSGAKGSSSGGAASSPPGGLVSTRPVVAPLSPLAVPEEQEAAYEEEYDELLEDETAATRGTRRKKSKRKLRPSTEGRRNPGKTKGGGRGGRTAADGRRGVGPRAGDVRRGAQAARSPVKKAAPPAKKKRR